ncbi:MAG: bifunctional oligoribonuclease/PAP phosphatase NrnA [Bacteroidota bacterium]|nr:bifunctional oligoribonuclease/PAP phosphatase NrnA [Bacteroidota bacterium]
MEYLPLHIEKQLQSLIEKAKSIVILSHKNPDGDAIGSSLGLYHFLKMKGKLVKVIVPNDYPEFLHWLPGNDFVIQYEKEPEVTGELIEKAELIFSLDFNDLKRLGKLGEIVEKNRTASRILIDHHPNPKHFCDIEMSAIHVSSTAELVYHLIQRIDDKALKNKDICECLYVGVMTDTGCFSFNSSNPATFRAVAHLLESGIDKDYIYDRVFNNYSAGRMKLMGYCLNHKMHIVPEYHTAYISLSQKEMKEYDFKMGDSEGFVNLPLSIEGIRFSAFFIEKACHTKISFRSRGDFPVNEFSASHFGGGGHMNAAGGESKESLKESINHLVSLLPDYSKWLK